jgi:hypothetical protein
VKSIPDNSFTVSQSEADRLPNVVMIGIPEPTYRAISDYASRQNMTVGQVISAAFDSVLRKTEDNQTRGPRLLTED